MSDSGARKGELSIVRFAIAGVVAVAALVGLHWAVNPDLSRRNLEFFPDMAVSPAVETQSVSDLLPGGFSQQSLVAGVVVRGQMPLRYGPGEAEAVRAGKELRNPFTVDDAVAVARGAHVYRVHCASCHDGAGDGKGPVVLRGMLPPPSLKAANSMAMPDGRMFHVLTHGQGNMPALRARIDPEDRWRAILHVRKLQGRLQ